MSQEVHKRPFQLFYGQSTRSIVWESNYSRRSRTTSLIAAVRAAISGMHGAQGLTPMLRVDVFEDGQGHLATIMSHDDGFKVRFTDNAQILHERSLRQSGFLKY